MFGGSPAHCLLIRHPQGIEVSDFKVVTTAAEARPCFVLEDMQRADFFNMKPGPEANSPVFSLDDVKDLRVGRCEGLSDTQIPQAKHKEL